MASLQWMDDALCRQIDADLFFPEPNRVPHEAKKACSLCRVRVSCLQYALAHGYTDGVWGGTTPNERKAMMRGAA